ncbi:MAG TPA: ATP-binding protein [Verrucomicrobiae bacterium]|nr:ATP-binding protein [Verrucomicrobiae bacterium]
MGAPGVETRASWQEPGQARPTLRWILLAATATILLPAASIDDPVTLGILLAFGAGNLVVALLPRSVHTRPGFDHVLVIADTLLVSTALFHANVDGGRFVMAFFLTMLLAGFGLDLTRLAAGATLVAGLYLYLLARTEGPIDGMALWSRVPFLYIVALHYGVLASGARARDVRRLKTEREKAELEALVDVTAATTSTLDLHRILYVISQRVARLVDAKRCSILQVDEARRVCLVMASSDDPDITDLKLDLSKYPEVRRAIETRRPVVIHDVENEELLDGVRAHIARLGFESILVLPLLHGNELLGMLFLRAARPERRFTAEEITSCQVVANASANALRNAMLYDEARREARVRRETAQKLQNILDHYPDLILTTDVEGRVTEFSRGGEALVGVRRDGALGLRLDDVFPEPEARARVGRLLREGEPLRNFETTARHQDGTLRDVLVAATILKTDSGPQGSVVIVQNVSELKAAREHLVQAEKLTALGEVVSGVAHELNNPLAGVLGYAQLLMRGPMEGRQQRSVERILDAALRCQKIVQNLLAFSRRSPSEKRSLGLNGLVDKALDLKEYDLRTAQIEVVKDLEADLPKTMLDFNQMQQVLLNLIQNAQYAMARHRGRGRLVLRTRHRGSQVELRVEDDGPGIAREHLARIFDPFFTTKPVGEGTGLGLSISYGIVRDHGGRIWAESDPGRGTTLVVELPVRQEAGLPQPEPDEPGPGDEMDRLRRPLRLLVVDDEPIILDLLVDALAGRHSVDTAGGGAEALRKLEQRSYDVVLLDLKMPGVDGRQVYDTMRTRWPAQADRVIFASGDTVHPEARSFIQRTGRPCVDKPFRLEALAAVLDQVAGTSPAAPATGAGTGEAA